MEEFININLSEEKEKILHCVVMENLKTKRYKLSIFDFSSTGARKPWSATLFASIYCENTSWGRETRGGLELILWIGAELKWKFRKNSAKQDSKYSLWKSNHTSGQITSFSSSMACFVVWQWVSFFLLPLLSTWPTPPLWLVPPQIQNQSFKQKQEQKTSPKLR